MYLVHLRPILKPEADWAIDVGILSVDIGVISLGPQKPPSPVFVE